MDVLECPAWEALFAEDSAILYETSFERMPRLLQIARERGLATWPVGAVSSHGRLRVRVPGSGEVEWSRAELERASQRALARLWNEEDA